MIHRWAQKFREHGTVLNLNVKDKRVTYSGRPKSARSQENYDTIRDSIGRSPRKSLRRRSQELGINRESIRRTLVKELNCTLTGYKLSINLLKLAWRSVWLCVVGSVTRLMRTLIPWMICDSWMKHISSCQAMWTQKTKSSVAQLFQKIVCNGHYILLNVQPGLPYQNMESLGHTGSRTIVNGCSWSTCQQVTHALHWSNNEEAFRRMVNGFSRMVLPLILEMKLFNGSDNVLEIASSVGDVKSSGHHIRQT